ncbi:MAG: hypothetical protein PUI85_01805 [Eubacteriales bacterium]|nr:hypothetical protein [Eubacteriales bacterium]MDY3332875.1 hypothetical protein [Gallibacter sp.]
MKDKILERLNCQINKSEVVEVVEVEVGYDIRKLDFELSRKNSKNFIFELYNNHIFNEERFFKFIGSIAEFIDNYSELQHLPEDKYCSYINEIIKNCEDILWAFTRHYMTDDDYFIENFSQIKDDLTQYYMYIREYSERLILNIQE